MNALLHLDTLRSCFSTASMVLSVLPRVTYARGATCMNVCELWTFIKNNDLERVISCTTRAIGRLDAQCSVARGLLSEVEEEIRVLQYTMDRVTTLYAFRQACWVLGDWRAGNVHGIYTDICNSLSTMQQKLTLVMLLATSGG